MKIFKLLAAYNRWTLGIVLLLSWASALMSIAVIAFIKQRFLEVSGDFEYVLLEFCLWVLGLLVTASAAQIALHVIGHRFVYALRTKLAKRIFNTDIEQLEQVGGPAIMAAFNTDVRNITLAFVRLPELLYGVTLTLVAIVYLGWLAPNLLFFAVATIVLIAVVGTWLAKKINYYIAQLRIYEDELYRDYQGMIDGQKELSLNRNRVVKLFENSLAQHADMYRKMITRADIFNGFAGNMANTLALALIGLVFYLSVGWQWADADVAATFALVMLFLRAPIFSAFGAIPLLVSANVSLNKIESLDLDNNDEFLFTPEHGEYATFNTIELADLRFTHGQRAGNPNNEESSFQVGPLNLTIQRGELIFVIGGNGSGKSTFAHLLTGIYQAQSGSIKVDGQVVNSDSIYSYRQLYSAIFTDFYLFDQLITGEGDTVSKAEAEYWLKKLELTHKVQYQEGKLSDTQFSQGQRKRLALMVAALEDRQCLLLDEWAADQDPRYREFFYRTLLPELKQQGKTIIAITHDDRYFDCADRILKMDSGQLYELDTNEKSVLSGLVNEIIEA